MAGKASSNVESIVKARAARAAKIAARREQEAAERAAGVARQLAEVRAKDLDQVTTYTVHFINGKQFGPGVVRAHPDIVDTIRDQMGYRERHRLDPRTGSPMERAGSPDAILPIRPTGVGLGTVMSPWAQQWLSEQAAETYVLMSAAESRRPEPGNQAYQCGHATGGGPCLQCGMSFGPSRTQTRRRSIFGETLA